MQRPQQVQVLQPPAEFLNKSQVHRREDDKVISLAEAYVNNLQSLGECNADKEGILKFYSGLQK